MKGIELYKKHLIYTSNKKYKKYEEIAMLTDCYGYNVCFLCCFVTQNACNFCTEMLKLYPTVLSFAYKFDMIPEITCQNVLSPKLNYKYLYSMSHRE